ncbi:MAG: hypothetical protein HOP28_08570 [Gemmatimonadales bacterium]|nr:hypothetical protein [Gemmatimonadales bacterium]
MNRRVAPLLAASTLLLVAACAVPTDSEIADTSLLTGFQSSPVAFNNVLSTFAAGPSADSTPWGPPGRPGRRGGHHGPMGPGGPGRPGGPFMMGGGLGGPFMGLGFGPGFGHRPPHEGAPFANCDFNAASGRVECAAEDRHGLTILRSASFKDAAGATQTAFDSAATNTINTRIAVSGTMTRRDGATSVVNHQSDRTVSGLATGSAQRTVNGTSSGGETTNGTDATGSFTLVRQAGDTVSGVVIPIADGRPSFPAGGTVVRSMRVVVTYSGQSPTTSTRREVITYDGSNTAKIVITQDGTTKNCTLPLPHGRISCS